MSQCHRWTWPSTFDRRNTITQNLQHWGWSLAGWMSRCLGHRAFGETGMSMLSLMYMCSTLLHLAITEHLSLMWPTDVMRISKREAMSRVREVEHGSFIPLVFSAPGGMAPAATTTFKRLASLISEKQQQDYIKTIAWIRCLLSFSLVRSSVMCLRGVWSSYHCPVRPDCDAPLDVALSGRVPTYWTVNSLYGLILSFISSIFLHNKDIVNIFFNLKCKSATEV